MSRFNPYGDSSGGSTLAIAGDDFVVLAGDSRHSTGYSIDSRDMTQVHSLGDGLYLTGNGFSADSKQLAEDIRTKIKWYHHQNNDATMSLPAAARVTSHLLYGKRFFPYYTNAILVGIMPDGTGSIYSFDPIGNYEDHAFQAAGHAMQLLVPFLDSQVDRANQVNPQTQQLLSPFRPNLDAALRLVKDAFSGVAERQIRVGDTLQIFIITKNGVEREDFPLRRD